MHIDEEIKTWLKQPEVIELIKEEDFEELLAQSVEDKFDDDKTGKLIAFLYDCGAFDDPEEWNTQNVWTFCSSAIESVVIPDGTRFIGDNMFYNCSSLKQLVVPDSIKELGSGIFNGCSLKKIKYKGTKEQWKQIKKWNETFNGSMIETIECIDGRLTKKHR